MRTLFLITVFCFLSGTTVKAQSDDPGAYARGWAAQHDQEAQNDPHDGLPSGCSPLGCISR